MACRNDDRVCECRGWLGHYWNPQRPDRGDCLVGLKVQNEWRQAAANFTEPPVRHTFELIDCENSMGTPDQIAVVEIESAERVHTNTKGETFLRIGDETRKLGIREAQELRFDKGESSFDGMPVQEVPFSELDSGLVDRYLDVIRSRGRPDVALVARGLAIQTHDGLVPTAAGLLMFGAEPQRIFPQGVYPSPSVPRSVP